MPLLMRQRPILNITLLAIWLAVAGFSECEAPVHFVFIDGPEQATFTEAQTVTITATAVSQDGLTIREVRFYHNGRKVGTATTPPYTYRWNIAAADNGIHRFHAEADYEWAGGGETLRSEKVAYEVAIETPPPQSGPILGKASPVSPFKARGLAVERGVAVMGAELSNPNHGGLRTADVSNPNTPRFLGSLDFDGFVRGVAFADGFAYALETHDSAPTVQVRLVTVDVQDPANPRVVSRLDISGKATASGNASPLDLAGSLLYVAATDAGLHIVDVANPSSPRIIGEIEIPSGFPIAGSSPRPQSLSVSGRYAFVGEASSLQVVDVGDPRNPRIVVSRLTAVTHLAVEASLAFAVDGVALKIYDVSNPTNPRQLSWTNWNPNWPHSVVSLGDRAVFSSEGFGIRGKGIYVLDIADASHPVHVQSIETDGKAGPLVQENGLVYAADSLGILYVIDVAR